MSQENLEDKTKKEGFWSKGWKKKKLEKPNMVAVIYLRENGRASLKEVKSEKGFFNIDGKSYHERRDCVYISDDKDKTPIAIIPEWSLTPIGTKRWYDQDLQEILSVLQDHAIKGIRHAERVRSGEGSGENKLTTKQMIVGGIILIILIAVGAGYF